MSKVLLILSLLVFVLAIFGVELGNTIALGLALYVGSKLV